MPEVWQPTFKPGNEKRMEKKEGRSMEEWKRRRYQ
jgi:hypothetical protein